MYFHPSASVAFASSDSFQPLDCTMNNRLHCTVWVSKPILVLSKNCKSHCWVSSVEGFLCVSLLVKACREDGRVEQEGLCLLSPLELSCGIIGRFVCAGVVLGAGPCQRGCQCRVEKGAGTLFSLFFFTSLLFAVCSSSQALKLMVQKLFISAWSRRLWAKAAVASYFALRFHTKQNLTDRHTGGERTNIQINERLSCLICLPLLK